MTINEVYNSLGDFLINLIPNEDWTVAELTISIQPKMLQMSGFSHGDFDEKISLRTKFDSELKSKILWLHNLTTEKGKNKWNRGIFKVTPDQKFEFEFIWDEQWQDEIDIINKAEKEKDPNYDIPKWHWDNSQL